jgi:ribosomal protein L17
MRKRIQKVLLGQKGREKSQVLNQLKSIFRDGYITLSVPEAKQVIRAVDRMIARVKDKSLVTALRYLQTKTGSLELSRVIYAFAGTVADKRTSGYTKAVHAGFRRGDHTALIRVEITDFVKKTAKQIKKVETTPKTEVKVTKKVAKKEKKNA